ncbi:hypothetical protein SELMODRAFT_421194 [Selaginella moellendorffii]|uniref:Uncharacterized protein n=1 Tax=Selaginella moellendorffii TaxID=88036 RepID=D8SEB4_SELML|nr:hypothetical protein SELMODRAFT_421194 [Selaginella moellendorffii]
MGHQRLFLFAICSSLLELDATDSGERKRLLDFQGVVSGKVKDERWQMNGKLGKIGISLVWERLVEVLEGQVNILRVELGEVQLAKLLAGKRRIRCHKHVKVVLFFDTRERALPFVREAAKKFSELMSFRCVLWRQEEASIWKSRLGLELAPAVVFIKDPAGKDVATWYCVVAAGRPGFQLDQLCSMMRIVQDELVSKDIDSHNFAAVTAYKDKRLSLSWLDGEMQKKFCYYCLPSEPIHETCRLRQNQEQDVARIFMIRFRRDPNHQKPVVKRINTWWRLDDEEQDLASMLIAPYSDANEISEVLSRISNSVCNSDTNEIPFFMNYPEICSMRMPMKLCSSAAISDRAIFKLRKGSAVDVRKIILILSDASGGTKGLSAKEGAFVRVISKSVSLACGCRWKFEANQQIKIQNGRNIIYQYNYQSLQVKGIGSGCIALYLEICSIASRLPMKLCSSAAISDRVIFKWIVSFKFIRRCAWNKLPNSTGSRLDIKFPVEDQIGKVGDL